MCDDNTVLMSIVHDKRQIIRIIDCKQRDKSEWCRTGLYIYMYIIYYFKLFFFFCVNGQVYLWATRSGAWRHNQTRTAAVMVASRVPSDQQACRAVCMYLRVLREVLLIVNFSIIVIIKSSNTFSSLYTRGRKLLSF